MKISGCHEPRNKCRAGSVGVVISCIMRCDANGDINRNGHYYMKIFLKRYNQHHYQYSINKMVGLKSLILRRSCPGSDRAGLACPN